MAKVINFPLNRSECDQQIQQDQHNEELNLSLQIADIIGDLLLESLRINAFISEYRSVIESSSRDLRKLSVK